MRDTQVYEKILETAELLIQQRGFNAFSFRDISNIVGVKTSSIHYYFPTKSALAAAVVHRHAENTLAQLNALETNRKLSFEQMLLRYIDFIFNNTYKTETKMCLGGMLATEVLTLNDEVRGAVKHFLALNETWLARIIQMGIESGEFNKSTSSQELARAVFALVEGCLVLVRLFDDERYLKAIKLQALRLVK